MTMFKIGLKLVIITELATCIYFLSRCSYQPPIVVKNTDCGQCYDDLVDKDIDSVVSTLCEDRR